MPMISQAKPTATNARSKLNTILPSVDDGYSTTRPNRIVGRLRAFVAIRDNTRVPSPGVQARAWGSLCKPLNWLSSYGCDGHEQIRSMGECRRACVVLSCSDRGARRDECRRL